MKKIIIIVLILLICAILLAKDLIAKAVVSAAIKSLSGLSLETKRMRVGIFKSAVDIEGLKLFNPGDYPERLMVDCPKIYVDYDLKAFLQGKVHLRKLVLNLKELVVVKNKRGSVNLTALEALKPKEGKEAPQMQIDILELDIGKAVYKDFSMGDKPSVTEFNLNIHERHENITDPKALISLIVFKAIKNTTIAQLANFDLGTLESGLNSVTEKASQLLQQTTTTAIKTLKGVKDELEKFLPVGK